jgi:ArsR family transcriptional regulator
MPKTLTAKAAKTYNERAAVLSVLGDATRLQVLDILREAGDPITVTDIVAKVGTLAQATISYHLRQLGVAGLVTREKVGVWGFYSIVPDRAKEIASWLA